MRTYTGLTVPLQDVDEWSLGTALRGQAAQRPDAVYLDAPDEGRQWTYAQVLDIAESLATNLYASGLGYGDRVLIQAMNSSALVFTWFGAMVGGLVEVPINTAYEYDFLAHQVRTSDPGAAVIDDTFARRFVDVAADCGGIRKFWVIDTGEQEKAIAALRDQGWAAAPFEELLTRAPGIELPAVHGRDLGAIFFTSGTTGPSKGVAMSHAQFYFDACENVSMTRLTADDAYMVTTPLFHGNAQWLAAYPALVAGARFVLRRRFSASRWIDWCRDSGVTVTNFLGVMMDFVWKQPPRENDADNVLRCIFAAPTASSIVDGFKQRFGIEAFIEVFGLTEVSMPIMSPYGEDRPPGAAGLLVSRVVRAAAGRPGDRRGGAGRRGRGDGRPHQVPVHDEHRLLRHAGEDRRGAGATCGSTPATRSAGTRTAGTTSSTGTRTRCAAAARTSAPTRWSRGCWRTRRCWSAR